MNAAGGPCWPDVEIWHADLADTSAIPAMQSLLSNWEAGRAARFVQDVHRNRFILRRGLRRLVLAQTLGCAPSEIVFDEDGKAKPTLLAPGNSDICFSTSHSGDQAVIAISTRSIGVDIEAPRALSDLDQMIARVCSVSEQNALSAVPPAVRLDHFFDLWTVKEAVAKLTGEGLSAELDAVDTKGQWPPETARYHDRDVALVSPTLPGPAKITLAAYDRGANTILRATESLMSSRSGGSGSPGRA